MAVPPHPPQPQFTVPWRVSNPPEPVWMRLLMEASVTVRELPKSHSYLPLVCRSTCTCVRIALHAIPGLDMSNIMGGQGKVVAAAVKSEA